MGQGAGDSCNQWLIGTNRMANVYNEEANKWTIQSPNPQTLPVTQGLKTFIDNANLFTSKTLNQTKEEFMNSTQHDTN